MIADLGQPSSSHLVSAQIPYSREILRKLIHLSSLWMVALMWFFPHTKILLFYFFTACLLLNLLVEYAYSCRMPFLTPLYDFFFGRMLRGEVHPRQWVVSGSPAVFAAAALVSLFFPLKIAAVSLGVMLTADTAAALFGRRFGRHRIVNGKSVEGVIAFCLIGFSFSCSLLACAGLLRIQTLLGAVAGTLLAAGVELFEKQLRLDDNFSIPLIFGLAICLSLRM